MLYEEPQSTTALRTRIAAIVLPGSVLYSPPWHSKAPHRKVVCELDSKEKTSTFTSRGKD